MDEADGRLAEVEGVALEKMVGQLYEERSRRGLGDFPITHRVQGIWDKPDIEIDLVAMNEPEQRIRFGTVKRSAKKLLSELNPFKGHIARFLETQPRFSRWTVQQVAIAPALTAVQKAMLKDHGVIGEDLKDLTKGLG